MASRTSNGTGGGNLSAGSSWAGGVAPVAGDTIIVANGDTITVDTSITLGSTASGVGHAVTINGASSSSFGTLVVPSGVTLTLRGFDQGSNLLMKVNRYGTFTAQPGATILGDVASDFKSMVLNQGVFSAIGTAGSHVTFGVPSGNVSWASKVNSETGSAGAYDRGLNLLSLCLQNPQVADGSQAGRGASGAFPTGQTAGGSQGFYSASGWSTPPTTEVSVAFPATAAQIAAAVNAPGKYAVDYDTGTIYLYWALSGAPNVGVNYFKLDKSAANWRGWGIVSGNTAGATTYNSCKLQYCDFRYMGAAGAGYAFDDFLASIEVIIRMSAPVNLFGHRGATAAGGDATTVAYIKNCTFNSCFRYGLFSGCNGASGDPILFQSNTCNDASGGASWDGLSFYGDPVGSSYVSIDANTVNHRGTFVDLTSVNADIANLSITNNAGAVGLGFVSAASQAGARTPFPSLNDPDASHGDRPSTPDLYVGSNTMVGFGENGGTLDTRFLSVSGTSGHPAIVEGNAIDHCHRLGHHVGSYVTCRENRFGMCYHHGFTGSLVDDLYCTDLTYQNNLFWCDRGPSGSSSSAAIQAGYNHRCFLNNLALSGNTVDGWLYGLFDFSDLPDSSGPTTALNVTAVDNVVANGQYAFGAEDFQPWGAHVLEFDYNVLHGQATGMAPTSSSGLTNGTTATGFYIGSSKYNRLTSGSRNIPGVALFDASYTSAQAGRTLAYAVNTLGQDHTLSWGGGTPQQLIYDHGTSAGGGLRTLACVAPVNAWSSANTTIRNKLLWVISGTGAGQVRIISYASANVAYAATVAAGGSGYSVGQYLQVFTGTEDSPGAMAILKVTSVSSGAVTGLQLVSGGLHSSSTPGTNPLGTNRITGTSGGGCTANLSWAPGVMLIPDLATALDNTSVFAVVNQYVQLPDSATGSVHAGLSLCDPGAFGASVFPTASQSDAGITVAVDHSPTGDPLWAGTFPGGLPTGVADDYKVTAGSPAIGAGTADGAPTTDYFGTTRANPPTIGFFEFAAAVKPWLWLLDQSMSGGIRDGGL